MKFPETLIHYRFEPRTEVLNVLRDYYLNLPKKTPDGWESVYSDTKKLNYLWRHYLHKECGESIDINDWPPPIHLRLRIKGIWL